MGRFRLLLVVIKRSGAEKVVSFALVVGLVCALVVQIAEPNVDSYFDALWFLWAVSMTVGLGDYTAVTALGRLSAIVCSLTGLVTTAILTAVVVDYFHEVRQAQLNSSVTTFLDKLEHLDELDKSELKELSNQVKKYRK